jgi:hypothetical protein
MEKFAVWPKRPRRQVEGREYTAHKYEPYDAPILVTTCTKEKEILTESAKNPVSGGTRNFPSIGVGTDNSIVASAGISSLRKCSSLLFSI